MKQSQHLFKVVASKGNPNPDGIPKTPEGVRSFPIHLGVLMQLVMWPWSRVLWCQWKEQSCLGDGYFGGLWQSHASCFIFHFGVHESPQFSSSKNFDSQSLSMKTWLWNFLLFLQTFSAPFPLTQHLSPRLPCLRSFDHQRKHRECPWLHPHFLCFIAVDQYSNLRRQKMVNSDDSTVFFIKGDFEILWNFGVIYIYIY